MDKTKQLSGLELRQKLAEICNWKFETDEYGISRAIDDDDFVWLCFDEVEWNDVMEIRKVLGFTKGYVFNLYENYVHLRKIGDGPKFLGMGEGTGPEAFANAMIDGIKRIEK